MNRDSPVSSAGSSTRRTRVPITLLVTPGLSTTAVTGSTSRSRPREHRLDDVVVPGAAAEVALEPSRTSRSVGFGCSSMSETDAITMPAVQNPHCSPWFSWKAACIGCSEPSAPASPSIVVIAAPSACAASIVQLFTDSPPTSTVHAPHDDVSQPTLVPVSAHASRRNCTSRRARLDLVLLVPAVDRHRDPHGWHSPVRELSAQTGRPVQPRAGPPSLPGLIRWFRGSR